MALFRKKDEDDGQDRERFAHEVRTARAVLRGYPGAPSVSFGGPTKCPDCGEYGFVVNVNHAAGLCANRCLTCGTEWTLSKRGLDYALANPEPPPPAARLDAVAAPAVPAPVHRPAVVDAPPVPEPPAPEPAPLADLEPDLDDAAERFAKPGPAGPPVATPAAVPTDASAHAPTDGAAPPADPASPATIDLAEPRTEQPAPAPAAADAPAGDGPLRVLMIEDNAFDFMLLEALLETVRAEVELRHAATLAEGSRGYDPDIDAVLLDLSLPDSEGVATLETWLRDHPDSAPVIVLSGLNDGALIADCRALGVSHYIQKQHLEALSDDPATGAGKFVQLLRGSIRKHHADTP